MNDYLQYLIDNSSSLLEIVGTMVGILYLWYEWKASIHLWVVGIIMPAIYLIVYYKAGLYADFGINIYYLLAGIYGWIMWKYGHLLPGKKDKIEISKILYITHISKIELFFSTLIFITSFIIIGLILVYFTNSNVPWCDSFTTAMSIVGLWLLSRKVAEQWLIWLVVDMVSAVLYVYKEIYFTAGLYTLYTIVAIFGYLKWIKLMKNEK